MERQNLRSPLPSQFSTESYGYQNSLQNSTHRPSTITSTNLSPGFPSGYQNSQPSWRENSTISNRGYTHSQPYSNVHSGNMYSYNSQHTYNNGHKLHQNYMSGPSINMPELTSNSTHHINNNLNNSISGSINKQYQPSTISKFKDNFIPYNNNNPTHTNNYRNTPVNINQPPMYSEEFNNPNNIPTSPYYGNTNPIFSAQNMVQMNSMEEQLNSSKQQLTNDSVEKEREIAKNVEFKYLRLIQELLFLITKHTSRPKGAAANSELMNFVNELLNVVQRHTSEPLDKSLSFQKPVSMEDIREKNQSIITLYQRKINYLTNKLNVLSMEEEEDTLESVQLKTTAKDVINNARDEDTKGKKEGNNRLARASGTISKEDPQQKKVLSFEKKVEERTKKEGQQNDQNPDFLAKQKSVLDFFLGQQSAAKGHEKGNWWLPENLQEEVEPWDYKSDNSSSTPTHSSKTKVEAKETSAEKKSGDSRRRESSSRDRDKDNVPSSARSDRSDKSDPSVPNSARSDRSQPSDKETTKKSVKKLSREDKESDQSIEELMNDLASDYHREKKKKKEKKDKRTASDSVDF